MLFLRIPKIQKNMFLRGVFVFFLLSFFSAVKAENMCSPPPQQEGQPKKLCFFALNGPEESQALRNKKNSLSCKKTENGGIDCRPKAGALASNEKVQFEIEEFYAVTKGGEEVSDSQGSSVSRAFEEMTKTHCDGLVISGHHFGFYTGIKTKQEPDSQGDRVDDDVFLKLDFLEKLSCLTPKGGGDCRQWFSNIKYLHLHGSYTAGGRVLGDKTLEDVVVDEKMSEYSGDYEWPSFSVRGLMREYASTVDQNNPLSNRYLKMFPNANIFSYKNHAKVISSGSSEEIMQSISDIGGTFELAAEDPSEEDKFQKGLAQILQVLSSGAKQDICEENKWQNSGVQLNLPSSSTEASETDRKLGCDFSESLASRDEGKITEALEAILREAENRPEVLTQNLNRIFYALEPEVTKENYKNRLPEKTRKKIIDLLRTSRAVAENLETQIENKSLGLVRRADFLYLYKTIFPEYYGGPKSGLEIDFMSSVLENYDQYQNPSVRQALSEIIWKNQLGSKSPGMVSRLITKLETGDAPLKQQIELLKVSAGFDSSIENISKTLDELQEGTETAAWMQQWVDLKLKTNTPKDDTLEDIASLYNSYTKDRVDAKKNELYSGIISGLLQNQRRCSDGYPLKKDLAFENSNINSGLKKEWEKYCLRD